MSNNGKVDFDGTSYFLTWADSRMTRNIEKNKHVQLNFKSDKGFLFVAVQSKARVLTDERVMQKHWREELTQWFNGGLDTEGLVMLVVDAVHVQQWGEEDSAVELHKAPQK